MATQHNFRIKNGLEVAGTERISSAGAFTGSLASATTATTQSATDNSTKIATTAYTDAAITALVDSSPGTLNTLNELAAALGDDANYATTTTNAIAAKLPLAGGTLTGDTSITKSGNPVFMVKTTGAGNNPALRLQADTNKWDLQGTFSNSNDELFFMYNSSTKMAIDKNGNVGIGTTSPDATLDVSRPGNGEIAILQTTGNRGFSFQSQSDTALQIGSVQGSTNLDLWANTLSFSSGGSASVTVDASGNVGIGQSNPSTLLDVNGTSGFSNTMLIRAAAKIQFEGGSYMELDTANSHADLAFKKGSTGDTLMTLDSSGRLGIGVTSPSAKLYVSGKDDFGASDLLALQFDNSPGDTGITFRDIFDGVQSRFTIDSSNTNALRISSGTLIDFYTNTSNGTSSPTLRITNSGHTVIPATSRFYFDGGSDTYITEYNGNELGFYTGGAQRVKMSGGHLYSNGNVYSGTSSTGAAYTLNSQTTYGSWGVGCHNASYAHHTTDRGIYYWNTQCQAAGGFHTYSDERLKEDVNTLTGALDDVAKMNGVTFKWKDAANRGGNSTGKQFGVLAQNMLEVDSELPQLNDDPLSPEQTRESDDSYYSMDYSRITPFLIEAVKELKTKLEAAEARIATLEG